jgi:hypothetical protein
VRAYRYGERSGQPKYAAAYPAPAEDAVCGQTGCEKVAVSCLLALLGSARSLLRHLCTCEAIMGYHKLEGDRIIGSIKLPLVKWQRKYDTFEVCEHTLSSKICFVLGVYATKNLSIPACKVASCIFNSNPSSLAWRSRIPWCCGMDCSTLSPQSRIVSQMIGDKLSSNEKKMRLRIITSVLHFTARNTRRSLTNFALIFA